MEAVAQVLAAGLVAMTAFELAVFLTVREMYLHEAKAADVNMLASLQFMKASTTRPEECRAHLRVAKQWLRMSEEYMRIGYNRTRISALLTVALMMFGAALVLSAFAGRFDEWQIFFWPLVTIGCFCWAINILAIWPTFQSTYDRLGSAVDPIVSLMSMHPPRRWREIQFAIDTNPEMVRMLDESLWQEALWRGEVDDF